MLHSEPIDVGKKKVLQELLGFDHWTEIFSIKMSRNNDDPQTMMKIPRASFWERLEAIHSYSGRGNTSQEGENRDLTNLLLLELLQKQNK